MRGETVVVRGGCRDRVAAVLVNLFLLTCALGMLAGIAFLLARGFRPFDENGDIVIGLLVVSALTAVVYVTHAGAAVGAALVAASPAIKVGIDHIGPGLVQPYASIGFCLLVSGLLTALALSASNLRRCWGTEVAVGRKGVYIRRVSECWIPWSYVDRVEEFSRFGQPAFRLVLNSRTHLNCKFLWLMSERHPTVSTRTVDIRPMVLREALYSRGHNFIP